MSLTGGGSISLGANGHITSASPGDSLTNFDTLQGAGSLVGHLTLVNEASGVIDASKSYMTIDTYGTILNGGLIEADGGNLTVTGTTLKNTGAGQVQAITKLMLDGAAIKAGQVSIAATGLLAGVAGASSVTGAVTNAGTLAAQSGGTLTVSAPVDNTGTLMAYGGVLTLTGPVSGAGGAVIYGTGVLEIAKSFLENVAFGPTSTGELVLDKAEDFKGYVSLLSTTGANAIDLKDIGFASAHWSYAGTAAKGVLTVADGAKTAKIRLVGDYRGASFDLADDGSGGVNLTDPPTSAPTVALLTQAMAGFGATPASQAPQTASPPPLPTAIAKPNAGI